MNSKERFKKSPSSPTRRSTLMMVGAAGLLTSVPALGGLVPTPEQTFGPFYPRDKTDDNDADLTRIAGQSKRAEGEVIEIVGRVLEVRGHALGGLWVKIWQADAFGIYHHRNDPQFSRADPGFQGSAEVRTARDGSYRFITVKPKSYRAGTILRTPHIHFHVIDGSTSRLVTQMYFPQEKLNQSDLLFGRFASATQKDAVTARLLKAGTPAQYLYDIVV